MSTFVQIIDCSTGQISQRNFSESEISAYSAYFTQEKELGNRIVRNELLQKTDFYANSDLTMSSEMTTYRQALRDLPDHSNWPNLESSDWPTKP
jgi:hypothetical protein